MCYIILYLFIYTVVCFYFLKESHLFTVNMSFTNTHSIIRCLRSCQCHDWKCGISGYNPNTLKTTGSQIHKKMTDKIKYS